MALTLAHRPSSLYPFALHPRPVNIRENVELNPSVAHAALKFGNTPLVIYRPLNKVFDRDRCVGHELSPSLPIAIMGVVWGCCNRVAAGGDEMARHDEYGKRVL